MTKPRPPIEDSVKSSTRESVKTPLQPFVNLPTQESESPVKSPVKSFVNLPTQSSIQVRNFGCRLNAYESELIRHNLNMLHEQSPIDDCIIINSCAVTAEAERQVKQAIRKAHRHNPQHKIVVTGCSAHIDPQSYRDMPEVNAVIDNEVKTQAQAYHFLQHSNITKNHDSYNHEVHDSVVLAPLAEGKVRAFLEVQNGCDHSCTFCTIPKGRGASRSKSPEQILEQVGQLLEQGALEIILCGVDLTDYGKQLQPEISLGDLVRRICRNYPELPRLRLSSLDCIEIDDVLMGAFAEYPQIQPSVHLSLQSGNDLILKRMKRRHLRDQTIDLCRSLRRVRPDIIFGADFICGFPTESESMFADTLRLVEECDITWLHVFPYSARLGTPAARIPDVISMAERKQRVSRLRAMGRERQLAYMRSLVGMRLHILLHADGCGYSESYAPCVLVGGGAIEAGIYDCFVEGIDEVGSGIRLLVSL